MNLYAQFWLLLGYVRFLYTSFNSETDLEMFFIIPLIDLYSSIKLHIYSHLPTNE